METAYTDTARHVRQLLAAAVVDHNGLDRPIARCDLRECHGTCCHDGVYLNPDEAALIPELVGLHRPFFTELGLDLPEKVVVWGSSQGVSGPKTATKPSPMSELASGYPAHFAQTQCVFLDGEARCGLQLLAVDLGRHPWYYKPFTCWMHPLSIDGNRLTLHDRESDPQNLPGYPGFVSRTPCGRVNKCGAPARKVLREELAALSEFAGRDLCPEEQGSPSGGDPIPQ